MSTGMAAIGGQQQQAFGQAMERSGAAVSQVVLDINKDLNEAETKQADNIAAPLIRKRMTEYLYQQGQGAVNDYEGAKKDINKILDDSAGTLKTDMSRKMFSEVANRRLDMAMSQVDSHYAQQTKVWSQTETAARIESARQDGVAAAPLWKEGFSSDGKPVRNSFSVARDTMVAETIKLAADKGFAPDSAATKIAILAQLTAMHGQAISTFLAGDKTREAQAYYDGHVAEIDPEKRDDIKRLLSTSTVADEALRLSQVISKAVGTDNPQSYRAELDRRFNLPENDPEHIDSKIYSAALGGLKERTGESDYNQSKSDAARNRARAEASQTVDAEGIRLARSLEGKGLNAAKKAVDAWYDSTSKGEHDTAVYKNALSGIEHDWTVRKAQEAEGEKAQLGAATKWFVDHPGASIQDFSKTNPLLYNNMVSKGHLAGLVSFARSNKVDTDPATWAALMTNQDEIKTLSPTQLFNKYSLKVSESDLNRLYSMNAALNGSKDENHLQIQSVQELVKDSAVKLDILPATGKPSSSQENSFNDFQRRVDEKIVGFESTLQGKRKASPEELRRILQEVEMDKVYRPRTLLSDKEVPLVSLGASDMSDAYVLVGSEKITVSSIPASQRSLIIPALRAAGKPVTEQNIADFWVRGGKKR